MKVILRNIIAVVVLVALVYFVTNYYGLLQQQVGVQGVSTQRAEEISTNITTDIGSQVEVAKEKALEVKVGEIVEVLSRFQKIPQDIKNVNEYFQEQIDNVLQSREKKE